MMFTQRSISSSDADKNKAMEWILQNQAGHLMMFTQRSISSSDADKNKAEN